MSQLPVVEEIRTMPDSEAAFLRLAKLPHCLFLDSARRESQQGRYSFITADPVDYIQLPARTQSELDVVEERWGKYIGISPRSDELPPFQGGIAGLFSYDLGYSIEELPDPRNNEFESPSLAVGLYDVVLAFDHQENRAWLISQGFPETDPDARFTRAVQRLEQFKQWLNESQPDSWDIANQSNSLAVSDLVEQFDVSRIDGVTSNFSPDDYHEAVAQAVRYIHDGDIFQVNLSQRLLHPAVDSSVELYLRTRHRNPAPFAGYFSVDGFEVVSCSPERFVSVRNGLVEARPIKGTRARTTRPEADLFLAAELKQSEKDHAENVMIVDLLRNDLSRSCEPDSVYVPHLCRLEIYQYVQHLVSVVHGKLNQDATPLDLLRGAFPGGSITGAPKVRAMEIIAELEPTARGPYCGSLGYISATGDADLSILIRTITAGRGWWQMQVGGGIVAQSDPKREYIETWEKATGMLRSLEVRG